MDYYKMFFNIERVVDFNVSRHHRANLCKLLSVVNYLIKRYYLNYGMQFGVVFDKYRSLECRIRANLR